MVQSDSATEPCPQGTTLAGAAAMLASLAMCRKVIHALCISLAILHTNYTGVRGDDCAAHGCM